MARSMHNPDSLRRPVESAVDLLNELLATLARSSAERSARQRESATEQDLAWLRPLATKIVDLEYTVRHRAGVDVDGVRETCDEIVVLLETPGADDGGFASRYAKERAASADASRLHARACAACRGLRRNID
jgi:hypothetical protein